MYVPPSITFVVTASPGLQGQAVSLLDINITSNTSPAFPSVGIHDAWCLDRDVDIFTGIPAGWFYRADLYSSTELDVLRAAIPTLANDGALLNQLDSVNWLLNGYYKGTIVTAWQNLQGAMWALMGNDSSPTGPIDGGSQAAITALATQALLPVSAGGGDGYVADQRLGQYLGLVADPKLITDTGGVHSIGQPLIIPTLAARLGDFVWLDLDANGLQGANEPGVNGVTVTLFRDIDGNGSYNIGDQFLGTQVTGDNPATPGVEQGYYEFNGLTPGLPYQVQFALPGGYAFTTRDATDGNPNPDTRDSDANIVTGAAPAVTLAPGEFNSTLDAGLVLLPPPRASLGNFVWEDLNANGRQDANEPGINGVTVTLRSGIDANLDGLLDTVVTSTLTAPGTDEAGTPGNEGLAGFYSFTGLTPGLAYQVVFTRPTGFISYTTQDVSGNTFNSTDSDANQQGVTVPVTLAAGEFNQTIDAGLLRAASLGNFVWRDSNGNGVQDAGEAGVNGVTATLNGTDVLGNSVTRVLVTAPGTDEAGTPGNEGAAGWYLFNNLVPGNYAVTFSNLPAGLGFTARDQGVSDVLDSDANVSTGQTATVTLGSGQQNLTLDAGVVGTGIDVIKFVNDGSGVPQDANTITGPILVVGNNATFTYELRNTGNVSLAGVTMVDDNGTAALGDDFTPTRTGGDANNNNLLDLGEVWTFSATRPVVAGQYTNIISAGGTPVYGPNTNTPGTPVPGLTPPRDTDPANYFGQQRDFGDLPSAKYAGVLPAYHVFANQNLRMGAVIDAEAAAQSNATATGDDIGSGGDDEDGVSFPASITAGQNATFNVSTTNTSGTAATLYGFIDWNFDGDFLDTGETATAAVANGFSGTTNLTFAVPVGANTTDALGARFRISNDASLTAVNNANTGEVEDYLVRVGPQRASLGNYVWEDLNANGRQDANEPGINGVTVTLYTGVDANLDGRLDTLVTSTVTAPGIDEAATPGNEGAAGFYSFTNLTPGVPYQVVFTRPTGFVSYTVANVAGNTADVVDSDANPLGLTSVVTLAPGEFNQTIDAGLLRPARLGDFVWRDTNGNGVQDEVGTGVQGVTVSISGTDVFGNVVSIPAQITNASGGYLFDNLVPGTYKVTFSNLPAGLAFTARDQGGNDATDSDADVSTGGMTPTVTLGSGQQNLTLDAGLVGTGIDIIKFVQGQDANVPTGPVLVVGSTAVFTYEVRNTGNVSLASVVVRDDNGTAGNLADDFAPTFTGGDVNTNGMLDLGEVWTYTASSTVIAGQYTNIATTTGTPSFPPGTNQPPGTPVPGLTPPTDSDPANYFGEQRDFGDLPSPKYAGVLPAYHVFANQNLRMGARIDAEAAAQPNATATGDDIGSGGDDEDGVTLPGSITAGQNATVTVSTTNTSGAAATLYGFVDWNFDGDFLDAGETATAAVANGFTGNTTLSFAVPVGANTTDALGARFRISNDAGLTAVNNANTGEVEDYLVRVAAPLQRDFGDLPSPLYNSVLGASHVFANQNLRMGARIDAEVAAQPNATATGDDIGSGSDDEDGVTLPTSITAGQNTTFNVSTTNTSGAAATLYGFVDWNRDGDFLDAGETVSAAVANGFSGNTGLTFAVPAGAVVGQDLGARFRIANETGLTAVNNANTGEVEDYLVRAAAPRPGIDIEKTTNGPGNLNTVAPNYDNEDTPTGVGVPLFNPGSAVTWTYQVTNTGNTSFNRADISVVDDNGTVGNTADDMSIANGRITFQSGDTGSDNVLSPGEVWLYRATGTAQNLAGPPVGNAITLDMSGNSALDGPDGNTRSFSASGVSVNVNAFSRDKGNGTWAQAYLGSYGDGLGVTDSSEGDGSNDRHRVDNMGGRDNYVVYSFNQNVVIDSAYLASVGDDSDIQVWIGTLPNAFTAGVTLSNAVLASLGFTQINETTSSASRLADLNAGNVAGNVLVIAANTTEGTNNEDSFKIESLNLRLPSAGVYANLATVTAPGVPSDSDLSHYRNPGIKASVGDRVWIDTDEDGVQDVGESGISDVKVSLFTAAGVFVASTVTASNGSYHIGNLDAGNYYLVFDKSGLSHNWAWSKKDTGGNDALDSDVNGDGSTTRDPTSRTDVFTLLAGQHDPTRDAGLTPIVIDLNGDGIQTVSRDSARGSFDLFGNGKAVASGWISGNDGFLAIDTNGNGKVDDISELFGGNGKGAGFAKLADFDSNGDGVVNASDKRFADLKVWQDLNGNHSTDDGELVSLAQAGIAALQVAYTALPFLDAQGNLHLERSSATRTDGSTVDMTDVYFNVAANDAAAAGVTLPTMADLLGDDNALDSLLGATPQFLGGLADSVDAASGGDSAEALRRMAAMMRDDCQLQAA